MLSPSGVVCVPVAPPKTPVFVFVLTLFAALGGFLLGYDIGIVSGSMLYVQPHFDLDTAWTEAIVSGALGAAAVNLLPSKQSVNTIPFVFVVVFLTPSFSLSHRCAHTSIKLF